MKRLSWFNRFILVLNLLTLAALVLSYLAVHISPEQFWPLSFVGLLYPYWLLANVLFAIYWVLAAKKLFLLPVIAILAGYPYLSSYFQISLFDGPKNKKAPRIKVMSYNVRLFDLYNWSNNDRTRDDIINMLRQEETDLICFQEFFHSERPEYFPTRQKLLELPLLNHYHDEYTHHVKEAHHFGIATFTRYPIINKGTIRFSNDINNLCIFSDILIAGDTLRVYNAHLSSIRSKELDPYIMEDSKKIMVKVKQAFIKRASQINKVMDHIEKSPHPVILCGDFNDTPVSYSYGRTTKVLEDAFVKSGNGMGRTYIGKFPSFRIDHIFHSPDLHSYDHRVLPIELSDHRPVTCMVELKE